jgi:hypothetical protein
METFGIEDHDYIYTVTIVQHVWLQRVLSIAATNMYLLVYCLLDGICLLIKGSVQYSFLLALFRIDYNRKFDILYRTAFQGT